MFALSTADLQGSLLGCGGGPASFDAEGSAVGPRIISVDPLYAYSAADIEGRIEETFDTIMSQARAQADRFVRGRQFDAARVDALTPRTASWYAATRGAPFQRFPCRCIGVGRDHTG
jgi:hypothetical protein